jgi:hypothetical protein
VQCETPRAALQQSWRDTSVCCGSPQLHCSSAALAWQGPRRCALLAMMPHAPHGFIRQNHQILLHPTVKSGEVGARSVPGPTSGTTTRRVRPGESVTHVRWRVGLARWRADPCGRQRATRHVQRRSPALGEIDTDRYELPRAATAGLIGIHLHEALANPSVVDYRPGPTSRHHSGTVSARHSPGDPA